MGAVVASLYGSLPLLNFLGLHKIWTFIITAGILVSSAWFYFALIDASRLTLNSLRHVHLLINGIKDCCGFLALSGVLVFFLLIYCCR